MQTNTTNGAIMNKSEDLWTSYKELYNIVNYHICEEGQSVNVSEFDNVLRKYKQNFFTLLQNPPKNVKSRQDLKKGMEEGIALKEIGHQVLSRDLYQEAIVLSDMYDLNEHVSLDLLCTAQIRMPYHYGLPRGLVAVLLYYDGRKCLVAALRLLIQARKGVAWNMKIHPELIKNITAYTNQLMEGGLFNRIFELLSELDLNKEIEKLQENLALGGPKHRRQVVEMYNYIKECLAEMVFLWSAQCGLPKEPTVGLINFMKQLKVEEDASGTVDSVSFFLLMALLCAMDLSVLHLREDGEEVVQNLPIISDKDYLQTLSNEMLPSKPKWVSEGLQSVALFGLSITIASLHLIPQYLDPHDIASNENNFYSAAIELKVFDFLLYKMLPHHNLYKDEILVKRIHYLLTDFILQMFVRVKELRIEADETARVMQIYINEGIETPATLPRHFEQFMNVIAKFYSKDPLKLQFSLEYWCPTEATPHDFFSKQVHSRSANLFKFVRLAGDLVPSTLFVAFLNMLGSLSTSPQGARYCFNMLKQNGSGFNSTVTWDHFFMSFNQYYNNLKQETPVLTDPFRRSVQRRGITPPEIEGLRAVLNLIKTVAEFDDFSRLALCEHPGWSPLTVLVGLVGCSIPIPLKANLLLTLSALAKSSETAAQMWENIEASQILVTIPTTSSYQSRGIQTELDEIESRMEEYPLTRALLKLLDVLTDSGIPRTLGAGPRKPGFDPYLNFIVHSVFLKINTRSYQAPEERWLIGSQCLKLFEKFLVNYEPHSSDFTTNGKLNEFNSPPGFHIMLLLNSKSEFLNFILLIIEEVYKVFQQCPLIPKRAAVCAVGCLNLLERALTLQTTFSNLMSSSANPMILVNLNKLLLAINPRSGQPDYCLNIAKYLGLCSSMPQHALAASKILLHITSWPALHTQYFNILISNERENKVIRSGFVECLDATTTNEGDEIVFKIQAVILKLLMQCFSYTSPNLSHFLFGFDLKRDLSQTIFQHPGVLDFPRTCLHSIFIILKTAVAKEARVHLPSQILESCYHMLYLLCANHKTSEPVLRFLRQNRKFFSQHLSYCYENVNKGLNELNQLSWLLKIIAIELKVISNRNQIIYLQQLCNMLMGSCKKDRDMLADSFSLIASNISSLQMEDALNENFDPTTDQLMIKLLNKFELNVEEVVSPKWEYLNANVLETLLKNCETKGTLKLIDIKKLHHTLVDEIGSLQGSGNAGQRQAIMQEIEKVLVHALNINNSRSSVASIIRFVDSWRQVVEVFAIYPPFQTISAQNQQLLNLTLLQNITSKALKQVLLPEVANYLSGAVLILMESTKVCYKRDQEQQMVNKNEGDSFNLIKMCVSNLKSILNNTVEWIMASDATAQNLRINLYASLVVFLQLISRDEESAKSTDNKGFYVNRLDNARLQLSEDSTSIRVSTDVFSKHGEKLIDLICQDCIDGHEVAKMLAMTTFSLLIDISRNTNWIVHMERRGYLKHIIQSILSSDKDLIAVLEPSPQTLKPLYLYMAKISLLSQIATTKVGAELLLELRILACFSSMKVFNMHPETLKQSEMPSENLEDFVAPIEHRYLQMFVPTLRICDSIITSLSTDNHSAISQIMYFLFGNLDVVEFVLRSGTPLLACNFLDELSCLTSVISRTADISKLIMLQHKENIQNNRAHLYRIQKLMLNLLPKFLLTEDIMKDLLSNPKEEDPTYQTSERLLHVLKIITNLITYSRNVILRNNVDNAIFCVIFPPVIGDVFTMRAKQGVSKDQPPTLGVIIQHLINAVNYYHNEKGTLDFLQRKIHDIPEMSNADLKEFMKLSTQVYDVGVLKETAMAVANRKFNRKKQEFDYCIFTIDNLLYILWVHLDYYLLKSIPITNKGEMTNLSSTFNLDGTLSSSSEATWKVSTDDISSLKQALVSIFNDSFSRQLLETTQGESDAEKQFVETLLRKIKRLIQFVPVK